MYFCDSAGIPLSASWYFSQFLKTISAIISPNSFLSKFLLSFPSEMLLHQWHHAMGHLYLLEVFKLFSLIFRLHTFQIYFCMHVFMYVSTHMSMVARGQSYLLKSLLVLFSEIWSFTEPESHSSARLGRSASPRESTHLPISETTSLHLRGQLLYGAKDWTQSLIVCHKYFTDWKHLDYILSTDLWLSSLALLLFCFAYKIPIN